MKSQYFIVPSFPFQGDQAVDAHAARGLARLMKVASIHRDSTIEIGTLTGGPGPTFFWAI